VPVVQLASSIHVDVQRILATNRPFFATEPH
jgi:hypothetical protein